MGVIADLMVNVGADISSFKKGMGDVSKDVESAGSGFAKFGGLALGAGAAVLAAGTGIAAFGVAAVQHAQDAGQAAFELSEKFGLLPGVASQWLSVADQLGVSGETIGKGFQFLSKNATGMTLTIEAGGKIAATTAEPYKELGINVLNAGGHVKDANELMLEAADAFAKMKDGPEKAALAMKLFGKSGTDMIPVLNQGRKGLEDMMKAGQDSGQVMSGPQVEAAHRLYLEHKQLDAAISGVTTQVGVFLMPIMSAFIGFLTGTVVPGVRQLWSYFVEHLLPAIQQVWAAFMQLLAPALNYIRSHFDQIKPVLLAVGIVIGVVIGAAIVIVGLLVLAIVGLVAGITWFAGQVEDQLAKTGRAFSSLGTWVRGVQAMWDGMWNGFRVMIDKIISAWNSLKFTIGGGTFAGVTIPSVTLGTPQIPLFDTAGTVPGAYGSLQLVAARGGERFGGFPPGGGGMVVVHQHFHIDGLYADGPALDRLGNALGRRFSVVTGR